MQEWHYKGHEFADLTVTGDSSLYLKNETAWINELAGMRAIMGDQAGITEEEVLGVRGTSAGERGPGTVWAGAGRITNAPASEDTLAVTVSEHQPVGRRRPGSFASDY